VCKPTVCFRKLRKQAEGLHDCFGATLRVVLAMMDVSMSLFYHIFFKMRIAEIVLHGHFRNNAL
jgi:hypothetical protein